METRFKEHLKKYNFDKNFEKLKRKLKNKKIIVYGTGLFFQYIIKNYDLSSLNIIGVSDLKYGKDIEGKEDFGYKVITRENIVNHNPDCVLFALENYFGIIESTHVAYLRNSNIKLLPICKRPIADLIKFIWKKGII